MYTNSCRNPTPTESPVYKSICVSDTLEPAIGIHTQLNAIICPFLMHLLPTVKSCTYYIKWKSITGASFSVLNGVKQGGVLFPVLFAVYIDGLLNRLSKSGVGCYMGNKTVKSCTYYIITFQLNTQENMVLNWFTCWLVLINKYVVKVK